jgi:hypothetical protein
MRNSQCVTIEGKQDFGKRDLPIPVGLEKVGAPRYNDQVRYDWLEELNASRCHGSWFEGA